MKNNTHKPYGSIHYHNRKTFMERNFDFSQESISFITICTRERECLFGKISGGQMILNDDGKMANKSWLQIPYYFPNVVLHQHIIMPNHVHGIIEFKSGYTINEDSPNFSFPQQKQRSEFEKNIPASTGSIIRRYKSSVTKWFWEARMRGIEDVGNFRFSCQQRVQRLQQPITIWQRNYYEHIIRNGQAYNIISKFITDNPIKWNGDMFF